MSIYTEILKSLPLTAFKLNSAGTGFIDLTNRGASLSAVPTLVTNLNAGATKAMWLGNPGINFATTIFVRGQEKRQFSLETTILPTDTATDSQAILSHNAVYDGLIITNNEIRFVVEFNTTGSIYVAYPIPADYAKMVVIGTYASGTITLYVNGQSVGQASATDAQLLDGFKTRASNNLYMGQATAGKITIMDSVAVYARALTDAEAYLHYQASNRVVNYEEVTRSLRPIVFDGMGRDIYQVKEWNATNWSDAIPVDVSVAGAVLVPEIDITTQLSKAGTWTGVVEIPDSTTLPKVYGVKLEWEGTGSFFVTTSSNGGSTWNTATNGKQVINTWDIVPTGVPLLVKVNFNGGLANDPAYVSKIKVTYYSTAVMYSSDMSRQMTLSNTGTVTSDQAYEPIVRKRYSGVISNSSQQVISADLDPDDPKTIAAVEFWFKVETYVTGQYVFDNRPGGGTQYLWLTANKYAFPAGGTLYANGVSAATATVDTRNGNWQHFIYVYPAAETAGITLNANGAMTKQYGLIKTYATAPTAAQAAQIFAAYNGYPTSRLATDANPVTEGGTAYKSAAFDWSITSAG